MIKIHNLTLQLEIVLHLIGLNNLALNKKDLFLIIYIKNLNTMKWMINISINQIDRVLY